MIDDQCIFQSNGFRTRDRGILFHKTIDNSKAISKLEPLRFFLAPRLIKQQKANFVFLAKIASE